MKNYLQLIDTHTSGPRCDVTPLFANPSAFAQLIRDLSAPYESASFDYVAGIDALGFILGAAVALHLNKGFVPIRKGGKLPVAVITADFVDYSGQQKVPEIRKGLIKPGDQVLLVDEWIETGAQAQAAIDLIEKEGGKVMGIAAINIDRNPATIRLCEKTPCHALSSDME